MWLETRDRINVDALELVNYRELLAPEYDRKMNIRTSAIQVNDSNKKPFSKVLA